MKALHNMSIETHAHLGSKIYSLDPKAFFSLNNMTTKEKFDAAVGVIQSLPKNGSYQPSDELRLKFYGLYKQATFGPNQTPKPGFWDIVGKYKWDSWAKLGNMSKEDAMKQYIDSLKSIVETMAYSEPIANFYEVLGPFAECIGTNKHELTNGKAVIIKNDSKNNLNDITNISLNGNSSNVTKAQNGNCNEDVTDDEGDEFSDTFDHMSNDISNDCFQTSGPQIYTARGETDTNIINSPSSSSNNRIRLTSNRSLHNRGQSSNFQSPESYNAISGNGAGGGSHQGSSFSYEAGDQIAVAILKLQQSIEQISNRLHTIESKFKIKSKSESQITSENWWPFSISPTTMLFLLGWPIMIQYLMHYVKERRKN